MNKKIGAIIIFLLCAVGIVAFVGLNYTTISDSILALGYQPTEQISTLENSLQLTDQGQRIFRASRPLYAEREDFNNHCDSHSREVAVLGCYTNQQIYLYRVDQANLQGINEATAAHELLHAVWSRLSSQEHERLTPLLEQYYQDHKVKFANELSTYSEDQRLDELHSRIGTEVSDWPTELRDHYARYFRNPEQITQFYQSYDGSFRTLKQESERLLDEINQLKTKIDQETTDYQTRLDALSQQITEFNQCAQTANCFTNESTFQTRRNTLISERTALEQLYAQINQDIETYNSKVTSYNQNLFRNQTLQNAINSNSQPPNI